MGGWAITLTTSRGGKNAKPAKPAKPLSRCDREDGGERRTRRVRRARKHAERAESPDGRTRRTPPRRGGSRKKKPEERKAARFLRLVFLRFFPARVVGRRSRPTCDAFEPRFAGLAGFAFPPLNRRVTVKAVGRVAEPPECPMSRGFCVFCVDRRVRSARASAPAAVSRPSLIREAQQARGVLPRHARDVGLAEPAIAHRHQERGVAVGGQRVRLLPEV